MTERPDWTRWHVLLLDVPLALAVLAFGQLGTFGGARVTVVLALLYAIPVAFRRLYPDAAGLAVVGVGLLQLVLWPYPATGDIAVPILMYSVAAFGRERWSRAWLAVGLAASLVAGVQWSWGSSGISASRLITFVFLAGACAALVTAAWFMGSFRRSQLARRASEAERAAGLHREQLQAVRLAATEERQRIAREMHDIVAHSLSVIVVQADGARYVAAEAPGDPGQRLERTAAAIETIAATARSALAETRRLVGVLHADDETELAPTAALADVGALVQGLVDAGRDVRLSVDGDPAQHGQLGAVAELAAYRVVQESLTNVLKHAGPASSARVSLRHRREGLTILVHNDGPPPPPSDGRGHGLLGMRERVTALGGSFSAGPVPGGFEVAAFIPAT